MPCVVSMGWFACSWCLVSGWAGLAGWDGRVGLRVASVLALTGLSPPPSIQTAADSATVSQPPGTDSYSELQKESARNRGFERNLPDDPLPTSHSPPPPHLLKPGSASGASPCVQVKKDAPQLRRRPPPPWSPLQTSLNPQGGEAVGKLPQC